jgi:hypothetical protein
MTAPAPTVEPGYPKFPHLENLDRVPEVLGAESVTITEKIHGFNARFGTTLGGEFWVGSRSNVVYHEDMGVDGIGGLQGFVEFAISRPHPPPGVTVYGEWAGKGIQKGIDYGEKAYYLFAVRNPDTWVDGWDALATLAVLYGTRIVPLIYEGPPPSLEQLSEWRNGQSALAPQGREGIVIWPSPMVFDVYGHSVIAKFKSPAWAETAHARREKPAPADLANVTAFCEEYATAERMRHVLVHVAEVNVDEVGSDTGRWIDPLDARHTGLVLRAFYEDVVREGADHYDLLSENDQKQVGKVLNRYTKALLDEARTASLEAAT